MSCSVVKLIPLQPHTAHVSLFTYSTAKKYEKKQISLCECQDSECTLLKCYLGFGNCSLGGLFGQKEREKNQVKGIENTHTRRFCLCCPRARNIICELSSGMTADWVPGTKFHQRRLSNLVAKLLRILYSTRYIWLELYLHSLSGHNDQANLITAKEWKVFYSFILHSYLSKCFVGSCWEFKLKGSHPQYSPQ